MNALHACIFEGLGCFCARQIINMVPVVIFGRNYQGMPPPFPLENNHQTHKEREARKMTGTRLVGQINEWPETSLSRQDEEGWEREHTTPIETAVATTDKQLPRE